MIAKGEEKSCRSLIDGISFRSGQDPQGLAFVFLDESSNAQEITNEQFYSDMQRYARSLIAKGICPGDIVLLALDHGYELLCFFWGLICCGAIPSIINCWHPGSNVNVYAEKVKNLAVAVGARTVVTLPDLYPAINASLAKIDYLVCTVQEVITASSGNRTVLPELNSEQIALMQFTSGTASEPKALQFSHRAILDHVEAVAHGYQMTKNCVYVSWLPFYHDMGLIGHILALIHGGLNVSMSPQCWLRQPEVLFKAIHRYGGNILRMPNFGFDYCTQRIHEEDLEGVDLSSLRVLTNGSEPVMLASMLRFHERFAPYGFCKEALSVAYGMAENVCGVSVTPPGQSLCVDWVSSDGMEREGRAIPIEKNSSGCRAILSCGYPFRGIEVKIVDGDWKKLADREVGEIAISSNTLFKGYYLTSKNNEGSFCEGWFRTGDLGYIADGQLYVCGRKKDLIIVAGRNIQPQAIEDIAANIFEPFAGRCAAFGLGDSHLGTEVPVLVIEERKHLEDIEKQKLIHQLRKRVLGEFDVAISDVRFVPKGWVVRTTSGKIARAANRRKYIRERLNVPDDEESKVFASNLTPQQVKEIVTRLFEKVLGIKGIEANDDFVEMGGDSLSALRLMLEIEQRFGQEISAADFFQQPTVEHVAAVLQNQISGYCPMAKQPPAEFGKRQKKLPEKKLHLDCSPDPRPNLMTKIKKIAMAIAHETKIALLIWIYGHKWTQRIFSHERAHLIRQFYKLIENPLQNERKTIQCSLTLNHSGKIKKQLLERIFSNKPGCWSLRIDIINLKRVYQEGKGVIIVGRHIPSPSISSTIMELAVKRLSPNAYHLIRRAKFFLPEKSKSLKKDQKRRLRLSIYLDQLLQAKKLLSRGEIVSILPDAQGGISRSVQIPLHGRMRGFKTGFAELAIETGAAVIPVSVEVDVHSKKVSISFLEPLNTGLDDMNHSERVELLVQQYAAFLQDEWARCPGSVPLPQIRRHLGIGRKNAFKERDT